MEKIAADQLVLLPHELICCLYKLVKWLCDSLPINSNQLIRELLCRLAHLLELLCWLLNPAGSAGNVKL